MFCIVWQKVWGPREAGRGHMLLSGGRQKVFVCLVRPTEGICSCLATGRRYQSVQCGQQRACIVVWRVAEDISLPYEADRGHILLSDDRQKIFICLVRGPKSFCTSCCFGLAQSNAFPSQFLIWEKASARPIGPFASISAVLGAVSWKYIFIYTKLWWIFQYDLKNDAIIIYLIIFQINLRFRCRIFCRFFFLRIFSRTWNP